MAGYIAIYITQAENGEGKNLENDACACTST